MLGTVDSLGLWRLRVSDRTVVLVSPASGNLLVELRACAVKGTGQHLSITHVYNNLAGELGVLGPGWTTSVGADIGLDISPQPDGDTVTWYGEGGCRFRFDPDGRGGHRASAGANAVLRKRSDGSFTVDLVRSGQRWSFTARGWSVSQADRNGNANTFHYGPDGALVAVVDSQGRRTTVRSDAEGRMTGIVDPTGRDVARYRHHADGTLTVVDPAGGTTALRWAPAGDLGSITDPAGRAYEFDHDGRGRVTAVSAPGSAGPVTTTFSYGDNETVRTDPNGNAVRYRFDADDRPVEVTNALGHTRRRTWTAGGHLSATVDAAGNTTTRGHDQADNLVSVTLPTGATARVEYGDSAHPHLPTAVTDRAGNAVTYHYDASGNLSRAHSVGLAVDLETRTYHGANGTLAAAVDGNGHATSYGYDAAGNLTSVTPPAPLGTARYAYDSLSRVVQTTSGSGHRTGFGYDSCGRLVSVTDDDAGTTLLSLRYDPLGNLVREAGPRWVVHYTWDRHLLTSEERVDPDGAERVTYDHDPAGNLVALTDAGGTTRFDYDAADRLTALTDPFGRTTRFGYDAADRRTSVTCPGGATQAIGYDAAGRRTGVTVTNSAGATVLEVRYGYTTADGVDSGALMSTVVGGVATTFRYDSLNRLVGAGASTFAYDDANNLVDLSGAPLTVNAANQHVRFGATTLHYDGAGNFTSEVDPTGEFTYSGTNQLLTGVFGGQRVVDLTYDGIDNTRPRRIAETTPDGTTVVHVFGRAATGVTQVVENGVRGSYVRAPDGGLVTMRAGGGNPYDVVTDHQGSVLALLDQEGDVVGRYGYTPFGAVSASGPAAGDNPFRYRGAYQLLRGAHLMGHRVYNAFWARFTQPDPTDRERVSYTFAANDPLNVGNPVRTSFWATLTCRPEDIANAFLFTGEPGKEKDDRQRW